MPNTLASAERNERQVMFRTIRDDNDSESKSASTQCLIDYTSDLANAASLRKYRSG